MEEGGAAVDDAAQNQAGFGHDEHLEQVYECLPAGTLTKLGLGASDKNANAMIKYASPYLPYISRYSADQPYDHTGGCYECELRP